jgi:hypothetical protein
MQNAKQAHPLTNFFGTLKRTNLKIDVLEKLRGQTDDARDFVNV